MTAPILVFGWGNPSRGDDALGPLFIEQLQARVAGRVPAIECLTDFQLQVEHALDLAHRQRVLFVDAATDIDAPFLLRPVAPRADATFTTHALSPEALLQVALDLDDDVPPATLLAIAGERFELGESLTPAAQRNLDAALAAALAWLDAPSWG